MTLSAVIFAGEDARASTPFRVQDPDGVEWEVYHLNYDLEDEDPPAREPVAVALGSLPLAKGGACCAS